MHSLTLIQAVKKRPGMYFGDSKDALRNLIVYLIEAYLKGAYYQLTIRQLSQTCFTISSNAPSSCAAGHMNIENSFNYAIAACRGLVMRTAKGVQYFFEGQLDCKSKVVPLLSSFPFELCDVEMAFCVDTNIITHPQELNLLALAEYCKPLVLMNSSKRIRIESSTQEIIVHYPQGIKDRLAEISVFRTVATNAIQAAYSHQLGEVDIALCFAHTGPEHIELLINGYRCVEGGDAVDLLSSKLKADLADAHYCVLGVIQLTFDEPRFYGSTKDRLADEKASILVNGCYEQLKKQCFVCLNAI